MNMKRCSSFCNKELPATTEYFYIARSNLGGFSSLCKECFKLKNDNQRKKEREISMKDTGYTGTPWMNGDLEIYM